MCAALKFYQAAENGTLKQGESLASAVTVDGKRFETVVHSVIYDINDDGNINIVDLVRFARMYGSHSKEAWLADFNSSGNVDIFDLVLMAHHYGMSSTSSHLVTYNSAYQPHNIRDVQPQPAILDEVPEETGISTAVAIPICTADLAIEEFWEEQEKEKEEKLEQILQKMR